MLSYPERLTPSECMEAKTQFDIYKKYILIKDHITDLNAFDDYARINDNPTKYPNFPTVLKNDWGRRTMYFGPVTNTPSKPTKFDFTPHRLDGFASISDVGQLNWYVDGYRCSDKMIKFYRDNNINMVTPSEEEKFLIKMYMLEL